MNRDRVIQIGALAVVAVGSNIHGRIRQHKKNAKVMRELGEEIQILFRAYARIQQRVSSGQLRETDSDRLKEHIEFEIIAAHEE